MMHRLVVSFVAGGTTDVIVSFTSDYFQTAEVEAIVNQLHELGEAGNLAFGFQITNTER